MVDSVTSQPPELDSVSQWMQGNHPLQTDALLLQIGDFVLRVRSNSRLLLQRLQHYFRHVVQPDSGQNAVEMIAIHREPLDWQGELKLSFQDWRREPGKTGRKDAYADIPGGRLVLKVRTGMLFLQCPEQPVAAGDCLANDNQVINFINAQLMNWLQQRDWLICHAAAVEYAGRAMAIAAFSGGGKSTSMLRLMDFPQCNFLTNDRLFIRANSRGDTVQAAGVPKLPRINPGTIIHNPVLQGILSADRRQALQGLPQQELWQLEEKYDVDVLETYGTSRIEHLAALDCLLLLNWNHSGEPVQIKPVDLAQRQDLLPAIMKSPGPFYQQLDGAFLMDNPSQNAAQYIAALACVKVYEVSGGVDFDVLMAWCRERLQHSAAGATCRD